LAAPSNISITTTSFGGVYAPGDLIFADEFDSFNYALWQYEVNINGGYNNEFQIYDRLGKNAYIKDGAMVIRPSWSLEDYFGGNYEALYNGFLKLEGCTDGAGSSGCQRQASYPNINPPAISARLRTKGTFSFTYGRVEARAKLTSADWQWPAIWMMPENDVYGEWPRSGEIDIMESRGNRQLYLGSQNIGSELVGQTLHFGPSYSNGWYLAHGEKNTAPGRGYDQDFHVYGVEWTPNNIRFTIDGQETKNIVPPGGGMFEFGEYPNNIPNPWVNARNYRMAPFDEAFHLILNVAVGGDYFPQDSNPRPVWGTSQAFLDFMNARDSVRGSWDSEEAAMAIDYIRIYAV
jgi:hypothetical protein